MDPLPMLTALTLSNCVYDFTHMNMRAMRSEVPANVDSIRTAQLAYNAAFDRFVEADPAPRSPETLDRALTPWPSPAGGFDVIGWQPDGMVRGTYWVEVSADESDFTVRGASDIDQDGEQARYVATRDSEARLITHRNEL